VRSIKIENNDIVITSKRMEMVDDTEQMTQRTESCLKVVKGELFYNADLGLNYEEVLSIKDKNISDQRKELAIRSALFQDSNVDKVNNIVFSNADSRQLNISVDITYKDSTETTIGGVSIA
jgi:hypothetical protein